MYKTSDALNSSAWLLKVMEALNLTGHGHFLNIPDVSESMHIKMISIITLFNFQLKYIYTIQKLNACTCFP